MKKRTAEKSAVAAAVHAGLDHLEAVFGCLMQRVLLLDINGTSFRQGGHEFHPDLRAAILRAIRGGILVVPCTDNSDAGIDRWFASVGLDSTALPIRIADHGMRIIVKIPGRTPFVHLLDNERLVRSLEQRYQRMNGFMARLMRAHRITPHFAHPAQIPGLRPRRGDLGIGVIDASWRMGGGGNVFLTQADGSYAGCPQFVGNTLGIQFAEWVERAQLSLDAVERHPHLLWHLATRETPHGHQKAHAAEELQGVIDGRVQAWAQVGDGHLERDVASLVTRGHAFAPRGTKHAHTPGVIELSRTCLEGAVPEVVDRLLRM